jgi:hypothetical protein
MTECAKCRSKVTSKYCLCLVEGSGEDEGVHVTEACMFLCEQCAARIASEFGRLAVEMIVKA